MRKLRHEVEKVGGERLKKNEKIAVGVAIGVAAIINAILIVAFSYGFLYAASFKIVSHNGDLGASLDENFVWVYNYTVYAKIKNVGPDGTRTVYCKITNFDLTTNTKAQSVSLEHDQERIVSFFFSNQELHGEIPKEYKVWIE